MRSRQGGNYREYLIGGILVQSLAFGLTGPATAISTDLTEGVIDRFRSLPATARSAYLVGHYLAELAGMALSIVVLTHAGFSSAGGPTDVLHFATGGLLLLVFRRRWCGSAPGSVSSCGRPTR